ncbi:hypothetical protein CDL15_Pgr026304 [Punica granatum]|uniref:Uncharacterized protein n=1 Tax=Punica granatum TaxID=22663 RepID=A0A218XXA0_PUNGR|nr:hypothetical protein CDL15_Pgr026304 [Punica granatum]PKI69669.1 hypothetical protein CRG98_009940 [Punica granatum]
MFGSKGYMFGRAGTRGRACSGVHKRGRGSGAQTDTQASEWEQAGARSQTDGHEWEQENVGDVQTCMQVHACRGRPRRMGRHTRAVTGAGARIVTVLERLYGRVCAGIRTRVSLSAWT